tara:strand:+ start:2177 stop:2458 length:282 start_codon:yes stop_codon:yes gene_type:complete
MSFSDWMRERSAEALGKTGLAGVVTTEAGRAAGIMENVTAIQVVSTAGILIMIVERSFNLYWKARENNNERLMAFLLGFFWLSLLSVIYLVTS